jgi:hypothetical protein
MRPYFLIKTNYSFDMRSTNHFILGAKSDGQNGISDNKFHDEIQASFPGLRTWVFLLTYESQASA